MTLVQQIQILMIQILCWIIVHLVIIVQINLQFILIDSIPAIEDGSDGATSRDGFGVDIFDSQCLFLQDTALWLEV